MNQQGQPPDDHIAPDGEKTQSRGQDQYEPASALGADDTPAMPPSAPQPHQADQMHQYPQQGDPPQQQGYGQPQQPNYPPQYGHSQGEQYPYSPPPQQHAGEDDRPGTQPVHGPSPQQYGGGDYHPQQPQPQPYYTDSPPGAHPTPSKKKGLPIWAWVVPLVIALLAAGGFGTWTYLSAQEKAASDARATSTAVAQGYATSTAQAQSTATAIAGKTSTAIAAETATAAAQANGNSNASLLKAASANMKAAKSYHLNITGKSGITEIKMGGDLDLGNNKSKLDISASGQNVTAISIGSDSYLSMDGGKTYTKSPSGIGSSLDSFTTMWDSFKSAEIDRAKDAIKDGSPKDEKVGSDDTHHMTASTKDLSSLSATGTSATDGTVDIWVTTGSKPTVRKMTVVGKDGTGKDINATIEWTQVDQSFIIEAPPTTP